MRKALRSFLAWMDARWPERVVVTNESYMALKSSVEALESHSKEALTKADLTSFHSRMETFETSLLNVVKAINEADFDKRIKVIESEINKLNVHMGFSRLGDSILRPLQR